MKNRISTLTLAVIAALALSACGGSDGKAAPATTGAATTVPATAAPTTAAPTTTAVPTTTAAAPTTTAAPATTVKPECSIGAAEPRNVTPNGYDIYTCKGGKWVLDRHHVTTTTTAPAPTTTTTPPADGMVWRPADADRIWVVDGITSRLEGVVWTDTSKDNGTFTSKCRDEAKFDADYKHLPTVATQCLTAVWSFDVAADFPVTKNNEQGYLTPGAVVTPEGMQIISAFTQSAYPGTVNNGISNVYVGGEPGSLLRFQTGNNSVGWTEQKVQVPGPEEFAPFNHN